jgi:hypothetical protein
MHSGQTAPLKTTRLLSQEKDTQEVCAGDFVLAEEKWGPLLLLFVAANQKLRV